MKKRLSEEQIIGFLREAEAGLPPLDVKALHADGRLAVPQVRAYDQAEEEVCVRWLENPY